MPWCQNCRIEYQDGCEKCRNCGADLVDILAPEPKQVTEIDPIDLGPATYIRTVSQESEANIIDSILRAEGIPTLIKHKDIGSIMKIETGGTIFGLDIYVPLSMVDKANSVLGEDTTHCEGWGETQEEPDIVKTNNTGYFVGLILIGGVCVLIIYMLIKKFVG